jgi:exodeoxyribonuclease V gamma subunit
MIHVTYSNRTEELLAALAAGVRQERLALGPWQPLQLVVPNRNVEIYLKLGLAERLGIAANLEVSFLRGLLAGVCERLIPGGRLVDARHCEAFLLGLLSDEALLERADLVPVREYLLGAGARPEVVDRRRCELAAQLGRLFDEYAASRPEMLRAWRERPVLADHPTLAPIESWQRALWLELFGPQGRVAAAGARGPGPFVTLVELIAALEQPAGARAANEPAAPGRAGALPAGAVHVFGVSYIARSFHAALSALARRAEVRIYTLNPCREFWEDVETAGEVRRRLKRSGREALLPARAQAQQPTLALGDDPFGLQSDRENLPLRLWGRPGRENVRLLNQIAAGDFEGRFVAHAERGGPVTLLARLQDDILDRALSAEPDPALRADGSLALLPCPGVRRELEVVAAEIWRLVQADPTLRLPDIALVVPEAVKDSYLAHLPAVFAEAHQLPHSVVDLPLHGGHRLGEAVELLLALPTGSFTRRELLPLLTHPALLRRFPDASATDWLRLAEDLGIVHGADRRDHAGTYIQRDVLHWDQGLRRLALGALMDGGAPADETPVALGDQEYLPLARASDEQRAALGFALLARSLLEDARFAAGVTGPRLRPLPEWLELARGLLVGYLVPADSEEEALLARCLNEIDELADLPLAETAISYAVAADLIGRALRGLGSARGQYLAQGVTVTSFVPMRAIPFRVVFVVGLGQAAFPAGERRSELDLRAARRHLGDVNAREQDLYMFLETLLSARDRLLLSYVARDELTGAELAPSSVVLELREVLGSGYLVPSELARFAGQGAAPPLRRYDDRERLAASPLAAREQRAKALGRSLRAALPLGSAMPDLPALRRALPAEKLTAVAALLGVHRPPEPASEGAGRAAGSRAGARRAGDRLVVPLSALRQFLDDPLQGSARFRLRLRELDDDDEIADREDEAFETERPLRTLLLREAVARGLIDRAGEAATPLWHRVLAAFEGLARREELRGRAPTGFYAEAERPALQAILRGWLEELVIWAEGKPLSGRVHRFGRAQARETVAPVRHDPIRLDLPDPFSEGARLSVEVVGNTGLVVSAGGDPASVVLTSRSRSGDDRARRQRDRLRAFVEHLALSAAGVAAGPHGALVVRANGGDHEASPARFRALPAEAARAHLGALVTDLVTGARDAGGVPTGVHPYLLPCEAVFSARERNKDLVEEIERLRDNYLEKPTLLRFSSVDGPVPEAVERHDPPPGPEARRMADRRFGLYFDLLEEVAAR